MSAESDLFFPTHSHMVELFESVKDNKWDEFVIQKKIARNVFLGLDEHGHKVVLKKLKKTEQTAFSKLPKEVIAGLILKHERIVKMRDYYEEDDSTFFLVFDFIEGMDLFSFMSERKFTPVGEDSVKSILLQLLDAITYSHSLGIVRLDIKLENIIIGPDSTEVRLIDFGLCEILRNVSQHIEAWVGSLDYACPEIYLRRPYSALKADVFSLGVVLYILLCGELPFSREERAKYLRLYARHPSIVWPPQTRISETSKDLLLKMLEFQSSQRLSINDVWAHKWLSDVKPQTVRP